MALFSQWTSKNVDVTLQWRHNERDGVSDDQPHDRLLGGRWIPRTKGQ